MSDSIRQPFDSTMASDDSDLRGLLDVIHYGALILDSSLRVRTYNRAFCALWDLPEDSLRGSPAVEELLSPMMNAVVEPHGYERTVDQRILQHLALIRNANSRAERLTHRDGRTLEHQCRELSGGKRLLTYLDVTPAERDELALAHQLREALDATAKAEARLSYAIENIDQGIVLYDEQWRVSAWNQKWVDLLGFEVDFLAARPTLEEIIRNEVERGIDADMGGDTEQKVQAWLSPVLAADGPYLSEQHLADGTIIEMWTNPLPAGGLVRTLSDVTTRRHAEGELRSAKEQAEKATLVKSHFLASMSHELRTPLNAIIGITEMLHEDAVEADDDDLLEPLARIGRAGKHLLGLINDILDLSKLEAGKLELQPQSIDLHGLVEEIRATLQPLASRNRNRLHVSCAEECGPLWTDPLRVRQVVLNLLSNACKFTEEGDIDLIVTRACVDGEEWIRFVVQDTGVGISPAQAELLFRDFSQVKHADQKYGGTGLGLAISHRLCRMMGGSIEVRSALGHGSTFTFCLPCGSPAAP